MMKSCKDSKTVLDVLDKVQNTCFIMKIDEVVFQISQQLFPSQNEHFLSTHIKTICVAFVRSVE